MKPNSKPQAKPLRVKAKKGKDIWTLGHHQCSMDY